LFFFGLFTAGFGGGVTTAGLETLGPDPLLEGIFGMLMLLLGLYTGLGIL
tara:strand:+ start:871 stop:1020 length:150 start_codon:yes stop_codon:yes gene_type:complete